MKKTILFVAGAVLALASCSKEETSNANAGRGIDFRASLSKGTRAVETTTASLQSFYVTAFGDVSFADQEFTLNDGFFTSTPEYYWPTDGSKLSFFAYAPSKTELGGTWSIRSTSKKISNFKPKTDIDKQLDFIVATAEGSKEDEATGVHLTFDHVLSQIGIRAKNGGALTYKVKGVKIATVSGTGTYDAQSSRWTLSTSSSSKTDYTVQYDTEVVLGTNATSLMGTAGNAMILPQALTPWDPAADATNDSQGAYLAVYINIVNEAGDVLYPTGGTEEDYGWAAVPVDTEWQAGHKYIYTLDFTQSAGRYEPTDADKPGELILGNPIKFEVEVSEWTDAAPGFDITM